MRTLNYFVAFTIAGLICGFTLLGIFGAVYVELADISTFEGTRGYAVFGIAMLGAFCGPVAGVALAIKNVRLQRSADFIDAPNASRSYRLLFRTGIATLACGMLALIPVLLLDFIYMDLFTTGWTLTAIATSAALTAPSITRSFTSATLVIAQLSSLVGTISLWCIYG